MKRSFLNAVLAFVAGGCLLPLAHAQSPSKKVEIAASLSTTGDFNTFGSDSLKAVQFALDEYKASGLSPLIEL
jgi:hypothetical protein